MNKDQNSQEKYLPIANISRIMKKALPKNTKISKEAKETFQECVSEFIGFVTSEASEKCIKENRKTVNGDDILYSLTLLGYEPYVEPLRMYLNKYRDFYKQEGNNSDEEDSDQVEQQNNSDKKNSQEKLE